jgi:hypothetical protein
MLAGKRMRGGQPKATHTAKEGSNMRDNVRRIVVLSAVVALVGLLLFNTVALAKGPDGATQTRTQTRAGDAGQTRTQARADDAGQALQTRTQAQDRLQIRLTDGPCSACSGDGGQVQNSAQIQNGSGFGPGDGTGPIGGGSFGPGPEDKCLDVDKNGICDCQE